MDEKQFKEFIEALYKKELDEKPTFSESMQKHIEHELQRMVDEMQRKIDEYNKPTEE